MSKQFYLQKLRSANKANASNFSEKKSLSRNKTRIKTIQSLNSNQIQEKLKAKKTCNKSTKKSKVSKEKLKSCENIMADTSVNIKTRKSKISKTLRKSAKQSVTEIPCKKISDGPDGENKTAIKKLNKARKKLTYVTCTKQKKKANLKIQNKNESEKMSNFSHSEDPEVFIPEAQEHVNHSLNFSKDGVKRFDSISKNFDHKITKRRKKQFLKVKSTEQQVKNKVLPLKRQHPLGTESIPGGSPKIIRRGSKRPIVKPVAFWRNEHINYRCTSNGTYEIAGIVPGFKEDTIFVHPQKRKVVKLFQGKTKVYDPYVGREVKAEIVQNRRQLLWRGPTGSPAKKKDPLKLCKSFQFSKYSMGIMVIDALQEKPCNYAPTDSLFFLVVYGKIEVCIHNSSWIIETDGSFVVPLGNIYRIKNLRQDKAKLIFFTIKGTLPVEELVV